MQLLLHIGFWLSIFLLVYTYVLYPWLVKVLAKGKSINDLKYAKAEELPRVSVLMAAYNEEAVLEEKMATLLNQSYPSESIDIYVGSDNSKDRTNAILTLFQEKNENIHFTLFKTRQGKPSIINQLARKAIDKNGDHAFLLTDASVYLEYNTIFELVKHFKNDRIGLVDACMNYQGMQSEGISNSENTYLSGEVLLKHNESKAWGKMIGPFGGCFAMRSELFQEVPTNYLVDDFYLAMKVLGADYLAINDLKASCYEPVTHAMGSEFKRKKRISAGNFQNLFAFKSLLNPFKALGFAFVSHKVIRWLGPFLMLKIMATTFWLAWQGLVFYKVVALLLVSWFVLIPLLDYVLAKLSINLKLLRNISYFNAMNWALFLGFFKFLSGVKAGIWEPTARS